MSTHEEQEPEFPATDKYNDLFDPGRGLSWYETSGLTVLNFAAGSVARVFECARKIHGKTTESIRSVMSAIGAEH